ncbi:MAG: fatty acid desaturase [Spirochaetia bacterium]|jgi:fatty acid desaturase
MSKEYEPMQQVRKNFQVRWYRSPIEPAALKELTSRNDMRGWFQTLGHVLLIAISGAATWYFFAQGIWVGFAIALFAHGTMYSFLPGLATHELAHGTVFKTKWLNSLFVRILSLISWFNFHDYKMSHTYHHLYTLHPRGDREVVLPNNPSLHPLFILQLLTLNVVGARREPYSWPLAQTVAATVKLAFSGRYSKEWLEAVYADQEEARRKSITWARLILLFHCALIAVSIVFQLWPLLLVVTFASFIANWLRYFVGVPMHTGLKDNVDDFRLCVRSITLDPFSQFLYWRMNWHLEHHMYAAVPCYNLKRLYRTVAADLPQPRTLLGAWKEMRQTWKQQQEDPGYQFETPLPAKKVPGAKKDDSLVTSLGDLPPKPLE